MEKIGQKLSPDELEEMIKAADSNGDGKIDYVEFIKLIENH